MLSAVQSKDLRSRSSATNPGAPMFADSIIVANLGIERSSTSHPATNLPSLNLNILSHLPANSRLCVTSTLASPCA